LIARRVPYETIVCLVQPEFLSLAERNLASLTRADHVSSIRAVSGDITQNDLGLHSAYRPLMDRCMTIHHFAAVYDLGVSRDRGLAVNVDGTRNVLMFAEGASTPIDLHYVSTCYVSGRYEGVFREKDLDVGQTFNNYYEETKYLAELQVRAAAERGLRVHVYRPSIVVGHSETGRTQKYDGPYPLMRWLYAQGRTALLPDFGRSRECTVNMVPVDFVTAALGYLIANPQRRGSTYHLADPSPLTVRETGDAIGKALGLRVVRMPMPLASLRSALRSFPALRTLTGLQPEMIDYFRHPTQYDCSNLLDALEATSIRCPPFDQYVATLVDYFRKHRSVGAV
jgi:thioester reductase-like protein